MKYPFQKLPNIPDVQNPETLEPYLLWLSSVLITCKVLVTK
ncbi:hypothetical protein [Paenibacillus sp. Leaf72]